MKEKGKEVKTEEIKAKNGETKNNNDNFIVFKIPENMKSKEPNIDLEKLYELTINELGLQQSKRDQLLTIYLAMCSFLIPFAFSLDIISWQSKGYIFLATAIVGILFANIIVRYRIYKEIYWLCCETITLLFTIEKKNLTKHIIQQCYFRTMYKKCKKYLCENNKKHFTFDESKYIKDNLTSAEFTYFMIHCFVTSVVFAMAIALILPFQSITNIIIAVACSLVLILGFIKNFFSRCISVYGVLNDGKNKEFNSAFNKAWFLHFYLDDESDEDIKNLQNYHTYEEAMDILNKKTDKQKENQ